MTAMAFMRYFGAGVLPIFAVKLSENIPTQILFGGYGGMTLVMLPVPFVLFFYGEKLRLRSGYSRHNPQNGDDHGKREDDEGDSSDGDVIMGEKDKGSK